jgi:hypothetical protein
VIAAARYREDQRAGEDRNDIQRKDFSLLRPGKKRRRSPRRPARILPIIILSFPAGRRASERRGSPVLSLIANMQILDEMILIGIFFPVIPPEIYFFGILTATHRN